MNYQTFTRDLKRTMHMQDIGAEFNITYHNGAAVADILKFLLKSQTFLSFFIHTSPIESVMPMTLSGNKY